MPETRWDRWKSYLYHASRSQGFLWKFAILTVLAGVALGGVLSQLEPSHSYLFGERVLAHVGLTVLDEEEEMEPTLETAPGLVEAFVLELADQKVGFVDVIWAMPALAPYVGEVDHDELLNALLAHFSGGEAELAITYLAAWDLKNRDAFERLKILASGSEPSRFARYVLGRIELKRENHRTAYDLFRQEGELEEAGESRFMAIRALIEAKDFAALASLRIDPQYSSYFTPHVDLEAAIETRDWWGIIKTIPVIQITSYQNSVFIVTIIAGFAWGLFLVHLGEVAPLSRIGALCGLGFFAGFISTIPTVFLAIVEDEILGFSVGEEVYQSFAYYIAGVGAREELCKLLLFLPLLPVLIKRDEELDAFIVAAFVGLGFAIEENGGYYMLSEAASAPGRFLTANFFHIALTGLNGLALFRACTRGMRGLNDLMLVLPLTITAHGVYDALLDLPDFDGGSFLAMVVYVGFSLYFFSRIHALRSNVRMTLSLTGSFVFGISILAATVIAFQMATLGAAAGASLIFSELLGSAILLLMFFREFNEPLTS